MVDVKVVSERVIDAATGEVLREETVGSRRKVVDPRDFDGGVVVEELLVDGLPVVAIRGLSTGGN